MHDHVYAPVKKIPLAFKTADPMRAEVMTSTAFVSIVISKEFRRFFQTNRSIRHKDKKEHQIPVFEYPPISLYFLAVQPFPHHFVYGMIKLVEARL